MILATTLLVSLNVLAGTTNRTIDDQKGDSVTGVLPQYQPSSGWNFGPSCLPCHIHLDPSQTFDGTWHDATSNESSRSVTLSFAGTALYVFGVLANTVPGPFTSTGTELTFQLDGSYAGNFSHSPTESTDYQYHVLPYAKEGLPTGQHTFTLETASNASGHSLILFDYAIYTAEDEATLSAIPTPNSVLTSLSSTSLGSSVPSPSIRSTGSQPSSSQANNEASSEIPTSGLSSSIPDASLSPVPSPGTASKQSSSARLDVTAQRAIGGAIGCVVVLAILLLALLLHRHLTRKRSAFQEVGRLYTIVVSGDSYLL